MAKTPQIYRKYKYFPKSSDKKVLGKYEAQAGQIVMFRYRSSVKQTKDKLPLVFVVDTDEFNPDVNARAIHGINLNYIPDGEVEKMFLFFLTKAGWDTHKITKFPRVNLWDEDDTLATRPEVLYRTIIQPFILPRFNCWRTYKYKQISTVEAVHYHFNAKPLIEAVSNVNKKTIDKKEMEYYSKRPMANKVDNLYRGKNAEELLKEWEELGVRLSKVEKEFTKNMIQGKSTYDKITGNLPKVPKPPKTNKK